MWKKHYYFFTIFGVLGDVKWAKRWTIAHAFVEKTDVLQLACL